MAEDPEVAACEEDTPSLEDKNSQIVITSAGRRNEGKEWKAIIALLWLGFLALGSGLLALYYARIGYLPDIEWTASIVYLAAASVIGACVGGLFVLSLFVPGLIWATFLVFDSQMTGVFCYANKLKDQCLREPCVKSILIHLGLPFGVILIISHFSLLLTAGSTVKGDLSYWGITLVLLLSVGIFMTWRLGSLLSNNISKTEGLATDPQTEPAPAKPNSQRAGSPKQAEAETRQNNADSKAQEAEHNRRLFKCSFWFTLSVLLSQISMFLMYRLAGRPHSTSPFILLTLICTTGVFLSNNVVAVRFHQYPKQAVVSSLVAASLLLFAADRFSSLSERMMGFYGFGEKHYVNLLLNAQGAATVANFGICNRCLPLRLCDVEILSRVGSEYYVSFGSTTLSLPKSNVIAYESRDKRHPGSVIPASEPCRSAAPSPKP